jgi:hypothetical protein
MEKVFSWTTHDDAVKREGAYWLSRSVEERVSAVETIREATLGIYDEAPTRLERVYRVVERPWGAVSDRRGARSGSAR